MIFFGVTFLNWIIKMASIFGETAGFSFLFLIFFCRDIKEIYPSFLTCFLIMIIGLIIKFSAKIIISLYKIFIGFRELTEIVDHNFWNPILMILYEMFLRVIIFFAIPMLISGIIAKYYYIGIDSEECISIGFNILIISCIGLFILYNILKTIAKEYAFCNMCRHIFNYNEINKNEVNFVILDKENEHKIELENNDKNKPNTTIFTEENAKELISKSDNNSKIIIPNNFTSIGDEAIYGNSSLTTIEIPNSITSIGKNSFTDCSSLKNINIPDSIISIGNFAFGRCKSLKSITIPDSVKIIGDNAFFGIDTVYYNGSAEGSPWGAEHHIKT